MEDKVCVLVKKNTLTKQTFTYSLAFVILWHKKPLSNKTLHKRKVDKMF